MDSPASKFYYTFIVPLTEDSPEAGRTEFFSPFDQPEPPVGVGDCLIFGTSTLRRGKLYLTLFF